jgi:hypothetical protein
MNRQFVPGQFHSDFLANAGMATGYQIHAAATLTWF